LLFAAYPDVARDGTLIETARCPFCNTLVTLGYVPGTRYPPDIIRKGKQCRHIKGAIFTNLERFTVAIVFTSK
jgi:hypothetical protein